MGSSLRPANSSWNSSATQLEEFRTQLEEAKAALPTLEENADALASGIPALEAAAEQAKTDTQYDALEAAYQQAEETLAANGGYGSYEEWYAAQPDAAQAAQDARDARKGKL